MDESRFWALIDESRAATTPALSNQPDILQQKLEKLSPEEIKCFDALFRQLWHDAYRDSLWAAAYIIEGGCSDDGFMDFRAGLISLGRDAYYAALQNPETLASQPVPGRCLD